MNAFTEDDRDFLEHVAVLMARRKLCTRGKEERMLPRIERVLKEWLASGARGIGQISIVQSGAGFVLCHRDDEASVEWKIFRSPDDASEIARLDDAGQLSAAQDGAEFASRLAPGTDGPDRTCDWRWMYFIPAGWRRWRRGRGNRLATTPLRETLRRQSGMYRVAAKISDERNGQCWSVVSAGRRAARQDVCARFSGPATRQRRAAFAAFAARQVHRAARPNGSRRKGACHCFARKRAICSWPRRARW